MLLYEVTVALEAGMDQAFESYMRDKHIPAIWETGCFAAIRFDRLDPERYRTTYHAVDQSDLDRYLDQYTEAFRADFAEHFPTGVNLSREIWSSVQAWP